MKVKCPNCGEVISIEVNKIKLEATVGGMGDAIKDIQKFGNIANGAKPKTKKVSGGLS